MAPLRRPAPLLRRLLLALALCALFARAAVPSGWMPGEAGAVAGFVPCDGMTRTAPHPMPGMHARGAMHHGGEDHTPRADHPCAFAGLAAPAVAPVLAFDPPLGRIAAAEPAGQEVAFVAPGRGLAAPPPPQTGPPAFA